MRPTRERLPARARAVARDFGNLNNYYIKQVLPMILVTLQHNQHLSLIHI